MNAKKLHEIERLSSLIVNLSRAVNATEVVDVGSGQGYLAQVLAFHHNLPVTAVDCSAHNTNVTNQRAERIKKYYASRSTAASRGPRTRTCAIGHDDDENVSLDSFLASDMAGEQDERIGNAGDGRRSIVLAGLHACGDLSANMLRTFVSCEDVAAVVSIGCCYNLLSEGGEGAGFPLSRGLKKFDLHLGGAGRDLGCQSAERWKFIGPDVAAANFEVHAYRAAFQIVLHRFYPDVAAASPSVGRLGKSKRRKQTRKITASSVPAVTIRDDDQVFESFRQYTAAALARLGLDDVAREDLGEVWKQVEPFRALIAPFWSLRSAIAPVLETMLLLDRLLYLKEEGQETTPLIIPVFDAWISPRNMAIVATRRKKR